MIGSILNGFGIVAGTLASRCIHQNPSPRLQHNLRALAGAGAVLIGLHLTWTALARAGSIKQILSQFGMMMISLILGKAAGQLTRIQRLFNRIGRDAKSQLQSTAGPPIASPSSVFAQCSLLYCFTPLAVLGSILDGAQTDPRVLILKTAIDGLAAFGFARSLHWSVGFAAIPVLIWQGTLTLGAKLVAPYLTEHGMLDPLVAVAGMQVFMAALVILELRRVALAEYLPSLAIAPFLAWLWHGWPHG